MAVTGTSPVTSATSTPTVSAAERASLDYDAFLRLLIAQIKNQDPTKPMDSAQFMSQLASFSNVEQAIKTNTKLDALMTSFALSQADDVIGRTVTSGDGSITGKVMALRIVDGGALAQLEDGRELLLGPGITVSGP